MISYVLPTRDRPAQLVATLRALGELPAHDAEAIIVDNASQTPPVVPLILANGIEVRLLLRNSNEGAAARNHGVRASDPRSEWIVMLDDDSHPLDAEFVNVLQAQPSDVAAVAAEIFLAGPGDGGTHRSTLGAREAGGLPEVFVGCGVAIRREAFLDAGGYDSTFNYYAEEYDLAAKLLLAGRRVVLDRRFRVAHHKVSAGRDMNVILRRLVRNNAWVMQRYAPADRRLREVRHVISRYGEIAMKEQAIGGYTAGVAELFGTLRRQPRQEMSSELFDRFTGLHTARRSLQQAWSRRAFRSASIVDAGKNAACVRQALVDLGVTIIDDSREADVIVIGTLSPGPLLDAWERRVVFGEGARLVAPWGDLVEPVAREAQIAA